MGICFVCADWIGTMTKAKTDGMADEALAQVIRTQIGSRANSRLLTRMGAFRAEQSLPDDLRSLLGELEHAERNARSARR